MTDTGQPAGLRREWWLMLLACLIGAAGLLYSGATARLDHIVYDRLRGDRPARPTEDILIVALDERSLSAVGAWPWPRATQAALISRLAAARPRAIGLDVLLTEPRPDDAALADAIRRAGNVYLPLAFAVPGRNGRDFDTIEPLPRFARAAAGLGHVNLSPDSDGVMRQTYLTYRAGPQAWSALPLAMLGRTADARPAPAGLSRDGPILIDYPGPAGTLATVSAGSVLRGEVPPELIAGKFVLVGMTASGLGDMHAAPFAGESPLLPGVELQGSLLATLLSPRQLVPAPAVGLLIFTLVPVLLIFLAMDWLPTHRALPATAGLILTTLAASALLLRFGDLWLAPAAPMLAVAAAYALWAWRRLARASGYVAQELARLSSETGGEVRSPGKSRGVLDRQLAFLADLAAREREVRQERDAMIRLLSHDMRAPQTSILALLDQDAACPPQLAGRIRGYAQRTLALADGFVNLSRAQLMALAQDLNDLCEIARDAADAVWPQAKARSITITIDAPDDEVLVRGDRSLLTRLLVNLLDNAVKYGDPDAPLIVQVESDQAQARIRVTNQGPDIAADQLGRIFEAFTQAPGIGHHTDGVGLGLAFVHTVAIRHGGTVTCHSAAGTTVFSVVLPLAEP